MEAVWLKRQCRSSAGFAPVAAPEGGLEPAPDRSGCAVIAPVGTAVCRVQQLVVGGRFRSHAAAAGCWRCQLEARAALSTTSSTCTAPRASQG